VIDQRELLTWINIAHSDEILLDRIGSLAEELTAGNLCAIADGDLITALAITPAGKALLYPTLPLATA
jgi:hypothetical protein